MNKTLNELKDRAKAEYEQKCKDLKIEYNKNLEAIDRVFALMNENLSNSNNKEALHPQPMQQPKTKASAQIIREIIDHFDGDFSVIEIRAEAKKMDPTFEISRNALHSVIKKKKNKGEIETVMESSGRSPAVYRKRLTFVRKDGFGIVKKDSSEKVIGPEPHMSAQSL